MKKHILTTASIATSVPTINSLNMCQHWHLIGPMLQSGDFHRVLQLHTAAVLMFYTIGIRIIVLCLFYGTGHP